MFEPVSQLTSSMNPSPAFWCMKWSCLFYRYQVSWPASLRSQSFSFHHFPDWKKQKKMVVCRYAPLSDPIISHWYVMKYPTYVPLVLKSPLNLTKSTCFFLGETIQPLHLRKTTSREDGRWPPPTFSSICCPLGRYLSSHQDIRLGWAWIPSNKKQNKKLLKIILSNR